MVTIRSVVVGNSQVMRGRDSKRLCVAGVLVLWLIKLPFGQAGTKENIARTAPYMLKG